ncbi:MAG: aspartate--tRNA(Asn) ligase [Candidatus Altiarchaeales archaeon]|nr:aspartate--tRNA(Asn) ligase [Candidatus Altiarchaeales archaeon]
MRDRYSNEVAEKDAGEEIRLAGWVHEIRDLGKLKFIVLRDRGGFIQVTVKDGSSPKEILETVSSLPKESVIQVEGRVTANPKAPGGVELIPKELRVVVSAKSPLPLDVTGKVDAELDTRLENRFMDVRKPKVMAVFKVRAEIQKAFRDYFLENNFIEINPPTIIAAASEGGTNLFPITYFEREAFLAQSPQLYKQMMMSTGLDRVFIMQPVFRAEPHNTPRHLNEIFQMDVEKAFIDDEEGVICELEGVMHHILRTLDEKCEKQLKLLDVELEVPKLPFKRVTYDEIIELLPSMNLSLDWGEDLNPEIEKALHNHFRQPYFVKEWPTDIRAFYSMPKEDRPEVCRAFDLNFMGIELSSGAQRIHQHDLLVTALEKRGLDPEAFEFYLKAFRYGMPPHGGWSIGAERITQAICRQPNIRECVLWPRDRHRITP